MKRNPVLLPKLVFIGIYHSNRKANGTEIKPEEINQSNPQSQTRHKEIILALKLKGVGCGFSKDQRQTPRATAQMLQGTNAIRFLLLFCFSLGYLFLFLRDKV